MSALPASSPACPPGGEPRVRLENPQENPPASPLAPVKSSPSCSHLQPTLRATCGQCWSSLRAFDSLLSCLSSRSVSLPSGIFRVSRVLPPCLQKDQVSSASEKKPPSPEHKIEGCVSLPLTIGGSKPHPTPGCERSRVPPEFMITQNLRT